jgi:catechol 2,3-dioxygenase-like lactoylglutathione lyase family enzyme
MLTIDHLDHIVLTVADIDATINFYTRVLGMTALTFGAGRRALSFGPQKINLHRAGHEFSPCARRPTSGSADFCLITKVPLDAPFTFGTPMAIWWRCRTTAMLKKPQ